MLKAKRILRDLKHNVRESKNLDISVLDIIRGLQPYEIDFKKRYGIDFDDIIYEDKEGDYDEIDLDIESGNSYNWNSQVVFNYNVIKLIDVYGDTKKYIAIKFHRYGDVRGNYTDYMILDMCFDQFCDVLRESSMVYCEIELNNELYEISTDCFKKACLFDIYSDDSNIQDYDIYLDVDNLRNKKDIKKALKQYLGEYHTV